jgi:hypothetical protein
VHKGVQSLRLLHHPATGSVCLERLSPYEAPPAAELVRGCPAAELVRRPVDVIPRRQVRAIPTPGWWRPPGRVAAGHLPVPALRAISRRSARRPPVSTGRDSATCRASTPHRPKADIRLCNGRELRRSVGAEPAGRGLCSNPDGNSGPMNVDTPGNKGPTSGCEGCGWGGWLAGKWGAGRGCYGLSSRA